MWLSNSSIGRKVVMSVTGIALVLFLTFHMAMNLVALFSEDAYNMICEFLGANWYALVATAGLAALFVIHIIYAFWLTMQNRAARGSERYAVNVKPKTVEWASQNMKKLPNHIECFDNSNIQGSDAVAACVVFKKAKPSKKEYRKYIIKTVTGPDDYASMKEVVRRRYSRAIEEGSPLPDLIITDGGKGQMEVVREVIEDELHLDIPIAGLAKDRKHRTSELLYGFPPLTIGVKQSTPLFHLLENIQNEVHRFAITFHRDKRSKSQVASALDNIKGIGEKRKTALLKTFKSVSRIKQASLEEIAAVVGEAAAKNIKENLTE